MKRQRPAVTEWTTYTLDSVELANLLARYSYHAQGFQCEANHNAAQDDIDKAAEWLRHQKGVGRKE